MKTSIKSLDHFLGLGVYNLATFFLQFFSTLILLCLKHQISKKRPVPFIFDIFVFVFFLCPLLDFEKIKEKLSRKKLIQKQNKNSLTKSKLANQK